MPKGLYWPHIHNFISYRNIVRGVEESALTNRENMEKKESMVL